RSDLRATLRRYRQQDLLLPGAARRAPVLRRERRPRVLLQPDAQSEDGKEPRGPRFGSGSVPPPVEAGPRLVRPRVDAGGLVQEPGAAGRLAAAEVCRDAGRGFVG